jgi:tetratricopeptide (TPR) repeat protein
VNEDPSLSSGCPELKVFVSSPGDVAEERLIAKRVLDRLAAEFAAETRIDAILWEHEPLLASGTFQTQIIRPAETDIVVCILWSRLGTRLPQQFKRPDGSPYNSGTEFEFEDALQGHKQRGAPDLLVYRKTAEPLVSLKDTRAASQALTQKVLLDEFVERFFHGEDGTLVAAFHPFENAADFETRLEDHLRKLIQAQLHKFGVSLAHREPLVRSTWTEGSPFRGLQVFEFQHHAIFFGRTRAIGEILERLKRQAAEGRAFLLVLGVSGCGKSSLVRAGVLPDLVQPGVVEGVGLWRRAILRPGERAGDLFDGLAAALRREEALPELASDGTPVEQLARMLRSNPEAAPYLIKGALAQAASHLVKAESSPLQPVARLVLVLDQLEELFTAGDLTPDQRRDFIRAISALAQSGQTWVVATLRSDFYHRCAEIPALVDLKADAGQYDVQPPDASEIAQLVRRPTLAAGLQFEAEDLQTGQRLDDLLRDAAAANRDSLPLLEFTLDELYRLRAGNVLTLQAYRDLGGMEGALARRADEVFAGLPPPAKSALCQVFRQLVTIGGDDGETPTRKQALLESFALPESGGDSAAEAGSKISPARQLVDALVDARLLTAKQTDDGRPVVEVTHEALLSRWQPLVDWLQTDRELLRIRGRINAEALRWAQAGCRADLLLQPGKPMEEGLQLKSAGFPLSPVEEQYVARSAAAARRRVRVRWTVTAALAALAILATFGGFAADVMRRRAVENQRQADAARLDAENQKTRAEQEFERARANFHMARDAVKKYQTAVANSPRLKSQGLEQLRRELLESANEFYQKLVDQKGDDPDLQAERVSAFIETGDIEADLGNGPQAEAAYKQAIAAATALLATGDPNPDHQNELARAFNNLGGFYFRRANHAGAEAANQSALAIRKALADKYKDNDKYQNGLAAVELNLSLVYRAEGRTQEAEAGYRAALAVWKQLAGGHADVAEYQYEITVAYRDLGNLYRENLRKKDQARAAYESELAICKPLVEKHPEVPDYQAALASCYADLGTVYLDSGGTQNAEACYKSSLALYKELTEKHPDVPHYQTLLAGTCNDFGRYYYTMNRVQDAEAYYKLSLAISKQLAEKYPDVPAYQIGLGIGYFNLGNRHRDSGRAQDAEAAYKASLVIYERVAKKHADVPSYSRDLAESYSSLAVFYCEAGRFPDALAAYQSAIDTYQTLAGKYPRNTDYADALADCYAKMRSINADTLPRSIRGPRSTGSADRPRPNPAGP